MKLQVTLYNDRNNFGEDFPDIEAEFNDVKEIQRDNMFFTVIKNNGDQHAVRINEIKKFNLIN